MNKLQIPRGYKDANKLKKRLLNDGPEMWQRKGRERALGLFKAMSRRVPAYKLFLAEHGIDPESIKTYSDLKKVPAIDKDNYLKKYPKHMLCWDGVFGEGAWNISTTSGSTGEPYYFPRQESQDYQYAVTAEQYLLSNFNIDCKSTLYIVAFPMGAWIGGVFTYEAVRTVAKKGYNLSIITPGIHKIEIINAIKQLQGSFDQIILGAYAPFLRDILEDGAASGIDWKSLHIKFIFSAEAFSEEFRTYVAETVGLKNVYLDTLNHYGTVDLGTMAHETPATIFLRRKLESDSKLQLLFPEKYKQPTFCQYDPSLFFFEEKNNNLYCSAYSGLPLFRYNLKDYGGIISYSKLDSILEKNGIDLDNELKANNLENTHWKLPFVYVYERNDLSVSYYAFTIYPDPVRRSLLARSLQNEVTGKFTMYSYYEKNGTQQLKIVIERTSTSKKDDKLLTAELREVVHKSLLRESSEYPEIFAMKGDVVKPVIELRKYEDEEYFRAGRKQQWIQK